MSQVFPGTTLKQGWDWLALLGIVLGLGVGVFNGVKAWLNPLNTSEFDVIWAIVTVVFFLMVAFSYALRGGRFLILLNASFLGIFILISILKAGTGFVFLVLIWLIAISGASGNVFLKRFFPSVKTNFAERLFLCVGLGLGGFAFMILILAILQILYSIVVYCILIGISLLVIPSLVRSFLPLISDGITQLRRTWQGRDLSFESIAFSAFVICFLCSLVWAMAPAIQHDALRYHLGAPVLYVQQHGLVEISEDHSTYYAHNGEMIYTLALILAGQPLPSLLHLTFGLLTTGLALTLGRRIGGTRAGIFSAILFFSLPLVTWESGIADVDMIVTFFTFGSIYCAVQWWLRKEDSWLTLAGVFSGLGLGTKLSAAWVILPLSLLVIIGLLIRTHSIGSTIRGLVRFNLPALILLIPWLLREWIWTGNPIYPHYYGMPDDYGSPSSAPPKKRISIGMGRTLKPDWVVTQILRLPWDIAFRQYEESTPRGRLAGISLLSLPWLYLRHSARFYGAAGMALLALMSCLFWFAISPVSRYLLPIIPVLAVLAALNMESLWLRFHHWGKLVKVFGLILALCYLAATRLVNIPWGWLIPERFPYRVALGLETPDEFLSRNLPVYDAFRFLDKQDGGDHKLLSIGNDFRVYTRSRVHGLMGSSRLRHSLRYLPPGQKLADRIAQLDYDYLLVNHNVDNASYRSVLDDRFLSKFTQLEFARKNVYVYRILDQESPAIPAESENLLTNHDFEQINTDKTLAEWFAFGDAEVDHTGRQGRSGKVAVQVRNGGCFFQSVSIVPRKLYTLAHWTRTERLRQRARLQINWVDENLNLIDVSIQVIPVTADWQRHKMSVTAPTGAALAHVYVSAHEKHEVWFDDFEFVMGSLYTR